MGFFLANCLGMGKKRRNSMGASPIPRFQIPIVPDDGVNRLCNRDKFAPVEGDNKLIDRTITYKESDKAKNWKPFLNACRVINDVTVPKVDSTITMELQSSLSLENCQKDEFSGKEQGHTEVVPLKEEDQMRKLIRTPTPDALLTFVWVDQGEENIETSSTEIIGKSIVSGSSFPETSVNTLSNESMDSYREMIPLPLTESIELKVLEITSSFEDMLDVSRSLLEGFHINNLDFPLTLNSSGIQTPCSLAMSRQSCC
jgi:hypothetical protein